MRWHPVVGWWHRLMMWPRTRGHDRLCAVEYRYPCDCSLAERRR